jgi:hypothetical protein
VQLTGKKKVDPAMAQKILSQRMLDVDMNRGFPGLLTVAKNGCVQPSTSGVDSRFFRRGLACTGRSRTCWNSSQCLLIAQGKMPPLSPRLMGGTAGMNFDPLCFCKI